VRAPFPVFARVVCASALLAGAAAAQRPKAPPAPTFEPGKIVDGKASNGVTWHVRVPKSWTSTQAAPALLLLHGSNGNSAAYVHTTAAQWPALADDYVLVGIDGENRVAESDDRNPAYNYTYVNWGGRSKYGGSKVKESPELVAEALAELKKSLKLSKVLVGGHSQGGFLSYSLFMNFPETFAGAFPISCGLIAQCEPAAYEDAKVRAEQRKGALAIVHAKDDPVVKFSQGDAAHGSFLDDGFAALRLFAPDQGAHMFALLPVEAAVRWLEEMTDDDPSRTAATLRKKVEAKAWRDVGALCERLKRIDPKKSQAGAVDAARKALEAAAGAAAKKISKAMATAKDGAWVDEFLAFREAFELADAAKAPLAQYRAKRDEQEKDAGKLWAEIRGMWSSNEPAARTKCAELMKAYPASSFRRYAKNALD
jgi:predicted esterase